MWKLSWVIGHYLLSMAFLDWQAQQHPSFLVTLSPSVHLGPFSVCWVSLADIMRLLWRETCLHAILQWNYILQHI
jgi:hypothetical protein